jgi:hypothetical protein
MHTSVEYIIPLYYSLKKLRGLSPKANYTDRATAAVGGRSVGHILSLAMQAIGLAMHAKVEHGEDAGGR